MQYGDNIVVSGLTAAGKTTHARLLANWLDYRYISATQIMLEIAGYSEKTIEGIWLRGDPNIRSILTSVSVARKLTDTLVRLAATENFMVFDAWGLSWAYQGPLVRLWIDSDRLSRSWKCYVSQGPSPSLSVVECAKLVDDKDLQTRSLFQNEYDIDIFSDRSVFDVILDNSWLIREPTRDAADRGIRDFDVVLRTVVQRFRSGEPIRPLVGIESWSDSDGYRGTAVKEARV